MLIDDDRMILVVNEYIKITHGVQVLYTQYYILLRVL